MRREKEKSKKKRRKATDRRNNHRNMLISKFCGLWTNYQEYEALMDYNECASNAREYKMEGK